MSDGGTTAELTRLSNFNAGGNENPTAMQPGPISRSQQLALPTFPAGSPGATNLLFTDPDADLPLSNLLLVLPADGSAIDPGIVAIRHATPSGAAGPGPAGPPQRGFWDDAAYQLGRLWQGAKTEAGLAGGTLWYLPGAGLKTLSNGQSFDTFQGLAKHSKLLQYLGETTQTLVSELPASPARSNDSAAERPVDAPPIIPNPPQGWPKCLFPLSAKAHDRQRSGIIAPNIPLRIRLTSAAAA